LTRGPITVLGDLHALDFFLFLVDSVEAEAADTGAAEEDDEFLCCKVVL